MTPTLGGSTPTGCSSSPTLPAGLVINASSCAISGTPTGIQSTTVYTISAVNGFGNGSSNINISVNSGAVVTTFAGSGTQGSTDATGTSASFDIPHGVAVDSSGNVYVAGMFNNKIRKISSAGLVTTLAGSGISGSTDATGTSASFNNPRGVAVDSSGNVYVADYNNHKIRKIVP